MQLCQFAKLRNADYVQHQLTKDAKPVEVLKSHREKPSDGLASVNHVTGRRLTSTERGYLGHFDGKDAQSPS